MTAGSVPTTNLNSFYGNTTSGTPASSAKIDAAMQDIVQTVNDNYVYTAGLVQSGKLSNLGILNVKDYGAKGDGVTDDTAAIQATINAVETAEGKVIFPDGNYRITASLQLPSSVTLEGVSLSGSIIDVQNYPLAAPLIVNKDAANFTNATIKNMIFRGGTYGIYINVSNNMESLSLQNVRFEIQTAGGIYCNKLLQICTFNNVVFYYCISGVTVAAFTSNHNNFIECQFLGLTQHSISMASAEVNNFIGCRFEAGGTSGQNCIILDNARNIKFEGCYFENVHQSLLSETTSSNSVSFDNCHFTAGADGATGNLSFTFTSDGIVNFGHNTWFVASDGAAKMMITGTNSGLGNNNALYFANIQNHRKFISQRYVYPTSGSIGLIKFSRTNQDGTTTNAQIITGKLIVHFHISFTGGFERYFSREYLVQVVDIGIANHTLAFTQIATLESISGFTFTIQQRTGATDQMSYLDGIFTGVSSTYDFSELQWSFEYLESSTTLNGFITADLP